MGNITKMATPYPSPYGTLSIYLTTFLCCDIQINLNYCILQMFRTWIAGEIDQLANDGFFLDRAEAKRSTTEMMRHVFSGRDAAAAIGCFLGAYLPFQYRHWAAALVKMSNLVLCCSTKPATGDWTMDIISIIFMLIVTSSLNTILIVIHDIHDPFNNGFASFPGLLWRLQMVKEFEIMLRLNTSDLVKDLSKKVAAGVGIVLNAGEEEEDDELDDDDDEDEDDDYIE